MSRAAYFDYLKETASHIGPYLAKLLEPYRDQNKGLYDELMLFTQTRLARPLQKPALFRLCYEICGGKDWEQFIPISAAFELLNISSYQANASFDNKLGALSKEQKDAQFICSMVSREIATSALRDCSSLSDSDIAKLEASFGEINRQIYQAQYLDLFVLVVDNLDKYRSNEALYLSDYDHRCRMGSGVFNREICLWGGYLGGGDQEQLEALRGFGEEFGTALHLINDLGDYAPYVDGQPRPRDYQDRYSDFRNGRLTLVLYHMLALSSPDTVRIVEGLCEQRACSSCDLQHLSHLVYTNGSLGYAKAHAKEIYQRERSLIMPYSSHPLYPILMQLLSVLRSNKYNTAFNIAFEGADLYAK